MTKKSFDIVTFGEAMALFLADDGAQARTAQRFTRSVAGAEVTVAIQCARLGLNSSWAGILGDDANGHMILQTLKGEGVDVSHVKTDPARFTGVLVRDHHAVRPIDVCYVRRGSAGAQISRADIDEDWIKNARWLHVTGITPALGKNAAGAVEHALKLARKHGAGTSLDINLRRKLWSDAEAKKTLTPMIGFVDMLFGGVHELQTVSGTTKKKDAIAWAQKKGVRTIIVSDGAQSVRAYEGKQALEISPHSVPAIDVVGAGDAFAAGIIAAKLSGASLEEALAQGCTCGALNVASRTDTGGLPYGAKGRTAPLRTGDVIR